MSTIRRRILSGIKSIKSLKEKVIFENKTLTSYASSTSTGVLGSFSDMSILIVNHYYRLTFDYEYTVTDEVVADSGVDITVRGGYWSSYTVLMKNIRVAKNEHSVGHIDCILSCSRSGGTNRVAELLTSNIDGHKGNITFKVTNMRFSDCTDGIDVYPDVFFASSGYKCAPSASDTVMSNFIYRCFAEPGEAVPVKLFGTIKCHIKDESTTTHYPRFVGNYRGFIHQTVLGNYVTVAPGFDRDVTIKNAEGGDKTTTYNGNGFAGSTVYLSLGSASGMVATWSNFEIGEFSIVRDK